MDGRQMMMTGNETPKLHGEELDKELHECMSELWKVYREAVTKHNAKPFNECFADLYKKHTDKAVIAFIECMGMGLVPAVNRRVQEGEK